MTAAGGALTVMFDDAARPEELEAALGHAEDCGLTARVTRGDGWAVLAVPEGADEKMAGDFRGAPHASRVRFISSPYPLASLETTGDHSSFDIRGTLPAGGRLSIGSTAPVVTLIDVGSERGRDESGPRHAADSARRAGGAVWHAGSHGSWGTGASGRVDLLAARDAALECGVALSVGVTDRRALEEAHSIADMFQIEGRDMQNFDLLRALGQVGVPVVLRRGQGATIEEFLLAAEYVLAGGNGRVALCEGAAARPAWGPRFEINALLLLKRLTHLPVIADVSGCSEHNSAIAATACAAIAAGADGVLLPVAGDASYSGGRLAPEQCRASLHDMARVAAAVGRVMNPALPEGEEAPSPPLLVKQKRSRNAKREEPAASAVDVLHRLDGTLADAIRSATEITPKLEVINQKRISPPYQRWLTWLLKPEGDLLVRWTSYKLDRLTVTHNLSYVDFARVDGTVLARLQAEQLNLGELFAASAIDKFGFAFGTGADAGPLDAALREGHLDNALHPYVWRRYIASTSGRVGFLVIEALPTLTWQRLLASVTTREGTKT